MLKQTNPKVIMNKHQIVSIPGGDGSVSQALGITDKRLVEIQEHLISCVKLNGIEKTTDLMEAATSICENVNETHFIGFLVGTKTCSKDCPLSMMRSMMKDIENGTMIGPFKFSIDPDDEDED